MNENFSIDRRVLDSAQRTARRHSMISALKNKGDYFVRNINVGDKGDKLALFQIPILSPTSSLCISCS